MKTRRSASMRGVFHDLQSNRSDARRARQTWGVFRTGHERPSVLCESEDEARHQAENMARLNSGLTFEARPLI